MDPTAPNNPTSPTPNQVPPSPIQPGQFVVAGDPPSAQPQSSATQAGPVAGMSLAQEKVGSDPALQGSPPASPPTPISAPGAQPDPTPFAPPTQPFGNQQPTPDSTSGGGSKMKLVLIILAILVLVGIIAAVVFLFILPKSSTSQTNTTINQEIEETSPPPQRTDGGFGTIPQSTESGQPTESGTPPAIGNDLSAPDASPTTGQ